MHMVLSKKDTALLAAMGVSCDSHSTSSSPIEVVDAFDEDGFLTEAALLVLDETAEADAS
jgi:hypothetical protein